MRSNINKVLSIINQLKFDDTACPMKIIQIPELNGFGSYENLTSNVKQEEIQLSIPNFKLFGDHEFVLTDKEIRFGKLLTYLPHIFALGFSIYGIFNEYYWFLLSLPVVFFAPAAYGFLSGLLALVILFNLSVFMFYIGQPTLGVISTCIFISMITLRWLKASKRSFLFNAALSHEAIFSYLFYNRTLSIVDTINNQIIYSKEDVLSEDNAELKPLEIPKADKTPYVLFKPDGNLEMKGRFIPEDVSLFSDIILDWLDDYFQSPAETTTLTLEFEYINDASKYLLKIIKKLRDNCPNFLVEWKYEEGDEDMLELGEMIWESSGCKFNFIEFY